MVLAGSEHLTQVMHIIAQSLMIPCYIFLLYFVLASVIELGSLFGEMMDRRKEGGFDTARFLSQLRECGNIELQLQNIKLPAGLKKVVDEFLQLTASSTTGQKFIAQSILTDEETAAVKKLERTDLISKMGPLLGLMGTLIPLGPGLLSLGQGDFSALSQSLVIAFNTTIIGIFAGGLSFTISKVRRRWYEHYLGSLESTLETIMEVRVDAAQANKKTALGGRV